jgi:hypothetical protein
MKTIHVSAVTLGNIFNDIIDMDKMERRKSSSITSLLISPALWRIWKTSLACRRSKRAAFCT